LVVTASAPAKVILFGEHFVVYGEPAVVTAIDKRVYASAGLRHDRRLYVNSADLGVSGFFVKERFEPERGGGEARARLGLVKAVVERVMKSHGQERGLNVGIRSSVPVAAGLGSSAAVAASTAAAVSELLNAGLNREEIFQVAYEAERLVHGTPSGIDPTISTYGGTILFQRDEGFTPIEVEGDIPLVVGNTGIERSTGDLVALVRDKRRRYPTIVEPVIKSGGEIARRAVGALKEGDLHTLGELMNLNHALLCGVGVSNEPLEKLVYAARNAGALGAKLTGAGGGGCMIALAHPELLEEVSVAIQRAGGKTFVARKSSEGVRIER